MVGAVVCMFRLAPANGRYKKAGIMRAIMLACTLITAYAYASSILNLAASILSIIAVYQEYYAHAELIADQDSKLSGKWHSLFNWGLVVGILVGFGATAAALILTMLELDAVRLTAMIVGVLGIPQMILDLVYMLYLKKMVSIFEDGLMQ